MAMVNKWRRYDNMQTDISRGYVCCQIVKISATWIESRVRWLVLDHSIAIPFSFVHLATQLQPKWNRNVWEHSNDSTYFSSAHSVVRLRSQRNDNNNNFIIIIPSICFANLPTIIFNFSYFYAIFVFNFFFSALFVLCLSTQSAHSLCARREKYQFNYAEIGLSTPDSIHSSFQH